MENIREINVFSIGDSTKISTWSNVPFYFTETLISKGIKVNRVNIQPSRIMNRIFNYTLGRVILFINKRSSYDYFRSLTNYALTRYRIKSVIKKYGNADLNIFLTFSFSSAGLSDKPIVLFGDWTFDHYIKYFENREADYFENSCINREDRQIKAADLIVPLFPAVSKYMCERYTGKKICYIGNVINASQEITEKDAVSAKSSCFNLLFIGSIKYIEGANHLIEAFLLLKEQYSGLKLDIIGIDSSAFGSLPEDVNCHGYLDKGNDMQRDLYYGLMRKARIFINTTPRWGAFSATIEAMYFYNPVIVTSYMEFLTTFGENIPFGRYCDSTSPELLADKIREILEAENYNDMCAKARNAVESFTWSAYIDKLLDQISICRDTI